MSLNNINKLIEKELFLVNRILKNKLKSKIDIINKIKNYMINGGGKRIRPIISLLSAKAIKYQGHKHIDIAASIEMIHIATLLHDDVIDGSKLRRGKLTNNMLFGNAKSILVGDFIYTKSFQMMTNLKSIKILSLMSNAANIITEGEIMQLMSCNNPNLSENNYMKIIYSKTACLFEIAAQSSAIIANSNIKQEQALKRYGKHFGIAFQIIDDLLDYSIDIKNTGKQIGNDLKEGKVTLPLLHVIKNTNYKIIKNIFEEIQKGNSKKILHMVLKIMHKYGSLEWARNKAKKEAKKAILALNYLPPSIWSIALEDLAKIAIHRKY